MASVKLALTLILILAVTSIIGTILPQGKPPQFYAQEFGTEMARLFEVLDLTNMYGSWWFVTLLIIFSCNLIICSIDRIPNAWRMVTLDNLGTSPQRLEKMPLREEVELKGGLAEADSRIRKVLSAAGWQAKKRQLDDNNTLIFAQKGAWSRLGAYLVHISILVILLGALVGNLWGYKASIMFPEGESVNFLFHRNSGNRIPLDFELHLENFEISYYPMGMVREYRSDVVINDPALQDPVHTSIRVNHPLKHRGLTFYQSSYQPLEEFMVKVVNTSNGRERYAMLSPKQQVNWPEENISFGVLNVRSDRSGRVHQYRASLGETGAEPSIFEIDDRQSASVTRGENNYTFYIQQRYATGLQVAKDPGVWVVYTGCALMLFGLYVTLLITHRRVWVLLTSKDKGGSVKGLICGGSNRNKATFDRNFAALSQRIRENQ